MGVLTMDSGFAPGPGSEGDSSSGGSGGGNIIGDLLVAGSNIYAAYQANQNNRRTIAANKAQAEYAYSKELESWNRQNAYNSPEAQMARLRAAGLNPNMMYGSGSGGGGQASQMPRYNAPTLQYNQQPLVNVAGMLQQYQDFRMRQAQIDNVKAQTQATQIKSSADMMLGPLRGAQRELALQKHGQLELTNPYQAGIMDNLAQKSSQELLQAWSKTRQMSQAEVAQQLDMEYKKKQMSMMDIDAEKKIAETVYQQYKNQWTQMGVTSSDNVMLRMFVRMLSESGINPSAFFK